MKILVTGAKGFVGRNLCENLKNLRDGKNRTRPALTVDEIYEYDIDTDPVLLEEYCAKADFVFKLCLQLPARDFFHVGMSSCRATLALPLPCWTC